MLSKVISYFSSLRLSARTASWAALLCALVFIATVAGSVYCGSELLKEGLTAEREIYLRRLIYFHFGLSQLSILVALGLYFLRSLQLRRYYLIVSYNERGMGIDPLGIKAPASCVFYSCLGALDKHPLPPCDAPILVYPMMMQSGFSSGERLNDELASAYAAKGEKPDLWMQTVLGASPLLPALAAKVVRKRCAIYEHADSSALALAAANLAAHASDDMLSAASDDAALLAYTSLAARASSDCAARASANCAPLGYANSEGTALLILAHPPAHGMEPAPEPALFCRRLRVLLPEITLGLAYFAAEQSNAELLAQYAEKHVIILPFLLTSGVHSRYDLPTASDAEILGKDLTVLPCLSEYLFWPSVR